MANLTRGRGALRAAMLAGGSLIAFGAAPVHAQQFETIGVINPHSSGFELAIPGQMSADGNVVAGFSTNSVGGNDWTEAFRWTQAGGIQGLGILAPYNYGYRFSATSALSSDGSVVAGISTNTDGTNNWTEAFRWTAGGGMQGLGAIADYSFGGRISNVNGMSSSGGVIVGYASNSNGVNDWEEAYRWTAGGGMQGLGVLGLHPGGYRYSYADAVSTDGSVVVGRSSNTDSVNYWTEAFRWTAGGGMQGLGVLGVHTGGNRESSARHLSSDGSVVAGISTNTDGAYNWNEAFRWTAGGGMQGLGVLSAHTSGYRDSNVILMSADGGVVAGHSTNTNGTNDWTEAYRWTAGGGMQGLGIIGVHTSGYRESYVNAMTSNGGVIVGHSSNSDGVNDWSEAFRWTAGGGMEALGVLGVDPGGYRYSYAQQTSSDGSVVTGYSTNTDGVSGWNEAFRWTAGGGMQTVADWIGAGFVPAGYRLEIVSVLSADGNTLTGYMRNFGATSYLAFWARGGAGGGCLLSSGDDTCLFNSATDQTTPHDAGAGVDTLQLGGADDFNFDVAYIGTTITNFETFQKVDASNVTLIGTAVAAANWDIQAGTLTASGGDSVFNSSIVNVALGATFVAATSETIGGLTGAGSTMIDLGQILTVDGASVYAGTTGGMGGLTKTGAGIFQTGDLAHTGLTTVSGGTLHTDGDVAGSVTVADNATFAGNFNVLGTLTGLGSNSAVTVGASPGLASVGALAGVMVHNVEVQFNNAALPVNGTTHDFLNITGNVTGTHTVNIIPFAPSTAPVATVGNGIELFRVGGTTAANAFALSGPVIQGGFEYLLTYLPDYAGATDGYFLQSVSVQQISLNAAMLAAGRAGSALCESAPGGHPNLDGLRGQGWADTGGGSFTSDASNGLAFDADSDCTRAGMSVPVSADLVVGLTGALGDIAADVFLPQGTARLDGGSAQVEAQVSYQRGSFFAHASLGYLSTDWSVRPAGGGGLSATVDGWVGEAGLGYRSSLFGPVSITLLAGLDYDGSDCGDDCLVAGTAEDFSEWSAGVHARFDALISDGQIKPFVGFGLTSDLDRGHSVSLGGASTAVDAMSGLIHADAGIEAAVWKSLSLYAEGRIVEGIDSDSSARSARIGAKVSW